MYRREKILGCLLVVAVSVTGCTMAPIVEVERHSVSGSYAQAIESMEELVAKCWTLDYVPFKHDNIYPVSRPGKSMHRITIGRNQIDIPFTPFAHITITEVDGGSANIIIEEGDAAWGARYDVQSSVSRWIAGDRVCRPIK